MSDIKFKKSKQAAVKIEDVIVQVLDDIKKLHTLVDISIRLGNNSRKPCSTSRR